MAQKYKKVDPRTWDDEAFFKLQPREKLIALYCITAQSNRCGIFLYSHARAIEHTQVDADSYAKAFAKVCQSLKWVYDEAVRVLYIPTWWKYNAPENQRHLIGCLEDIHDVPTTRLMSVFKENLSYLPDYLKEVFKTKLSDSYAKAMPNHKHEHKHEHEHNIPAIKPPEESSDSKKSENAADDRKPRKKVEPTGDHQTAVKHFCEAWEKKYGAKYPFSGGKDGDHVSWMLKQVPDLRHATEIMDRYLASADEFFVKDRHSVGMLRSQWRKFIVDAPKAAKSAPAQSVVLGEV